MGLTFLLPFLNRYKWYFILPLTFFTLLGIGYCQLKKNVKHELIREAHEEHIKRREAESKVIEHGRKIQRKIIERQKADRGPHQRLLDEYYSCVLSSNTFADPNCERLPTTSP